MALNLKSNSRGLFISALLSILVVCMSQADLFAQNGQAGGSSDVVRNAIDLYDQGKIGEAEIVSLMALDQPDQLSRFDKFSLHNVLAFCAIAKDETENGKRHFVEALVLNPSLAPDPITWSPKIIRVFEEARREYIAKVQVERDSRAAKIAEICRNASLSSLYLPGAGQLAKGEREKGLIYGGLFLLATGTFLYSQFNLPQARSEYLDATNPVDANRLWRDYRDTYRVSVISASVAVTVYGISFFDALWTPPTNLPE